MNARIDGLELRVLAGLQAGARLMLTTGRHVLGAGDACDIVLAGPGVESQALVIVVEGDQLHLQPSQPGCGVAPGDSLSEPFVLKPGIPFHVGDIWLVIDPCEKPWPENRSWLVPMPPALDAIFIEPTDRRDEMADEPPLGDASTVVEKRWIWLGFKWAGWCIAVFCLGGLGVLAWFRFGMEYLPNMRAMTASHLSRFAMDADRQAAPEPRPVRSLSVASAAPTLSTESKTAGPVLMTPPPAPARATASEEEDPLLGLPLVGTHLVRSPSRDRPAPAEARAVSTAQLERLPFVVRQVACGSVASITTDKGFKFFEGATHKGYELTKTAPDRLRLRSGRHDVELPC